MSIVVKGMDMPDGCWCNDSAGYRQCALFDEDFYCAQLCRYVGNNLNYRPDDCPLEELKEGPDKESVPERRVAGRKHPTRADKIRSMTDEGLADAMVRAYGEAEVCPPSHSHVYCLREDGCRLCWTHWLKEKA